MDALCRLALYLGNDRSTDIPTQVTADLHKILADTLSGRIAWALMSDSRSPVQLCDFEDYAQENGQTFWNARWLMKRLGYKSYSNFVKVINEAIGSCMRLGVNCQEAFRQCKEVTSEGEVESYKLNRFACYLIAMHADPKKEEVRQIRVYLAAYAAAVAEREFQDDALLRVEMRERLKEGESLMSKVAYNDAGLTGGVDMAMFKDAGYQGMYNMSRKTLLKKRGLDIKDKIYDHMGVVELAANNFRVTQTAERIKNHRLKGVDSTARAAREVGAKVRLEMIANGGTSPENLPIEENIKHVQSGLKKASKKMQKLDGKVGGKTKKKTLPRSAGKN